MLVIITEKLIVKEKSDGSFDTIPNSSKLILVENLTCMDNMSIVLCWKTDSTKNDSPGYCRDTERNKKCA